MGIKHLALILLLAAGIYQYDSPQPSQLTDYVDEESGFRLRYPAYWILETDVDRMIEVQQGSIEALRVDVSEDKRETYKLLIHVDGNPDYLSNVAILVDQHLADGSPGYPDSESAVNAVVEGFEETKASGTFFLEEIYLGESHVHVYRRRVRIPDWNDEITITYYLTASRTHAYMLVQSVLMSEMDDVNMDHFNQLIQSFRVIANESGNVDPSLDWGAFKPGEETESIDTSGNVGRIEVREDFRNNSRGWPEGDDSEIKDGLYVLRSSDFPFTVRNTGLGQIGFDFSYEGEVTFLDGDESAGYGLVFGYRDADNYFAFLITGGGQFIVIEEKDGAFVEHVPWTASDSLVGDTHSIMVQGDYQTVTDPQRLHRYELVFYVDKKPVANIRLGRVLDVSGWFGIYVSRELEVAFDWLESRNYVLDAVMTLERFE